VLLLALDTCAAYCRYCTRSRLVNQGELDALPRRVDAVISYLEEHTEVRDVLLSGGDPLLMSEDRLDEILGRIRAIPHIEFVRIGSRVPSFLPQRITQELVRVLRNNRVWLSLHFCHAREVTPEVANACDMLADGGIPLGAQTVLLKGINDDVQTLKDLFHALLRIRVRPYYLHQRAQGDRAHLRAARAHYRVCGPDVCDRRARRRRKGAAPGRDHPVVRERSGGAAQLGGVHLLLRGPGGAPLGAWGSRSGSVTT
jgi:KamA family protein